MRLPLPKKKIIKEKFHLSCLCRNLFLSVTIPHTITPIIPATIKPKKIPTITAKNPVKSELSIPIPIILLIIYYIFFIFTDKSDEI